MPTITSRDDLTAYVTEALATDPDIDGVNIDGLVDAVKDQADVEYGVTTDTQIEQRLTIDGFTALVEAHARPLV